MKIQEKILMKGQRPSDFKESLTGYLQYLATQTILKSTRSLLS